MKIWPLLTLSLLVVGCASTRDSIQKPVEDPILSAILHGSLSELREATANRDLSGRSELHNALAARCSSLEHSKNGVEMAGLLISKGALPVEQETKDPVVQEHARVPDVLRDMNIWGPLQGSTVANCRALGSFYLEKMSPEDIAKGALAIESRNFDTGGFGLPPDAPEWSKLPAPHDLGTARLLKKKNSELCSQGHETSCRASRHLENQFKPVEIAFNFALISDACAKEAEIKELRERMDQQIVLGKKTGVANPELHDALVSQIQKLESQLSGTRNMYRLTNEREMEACA